MTFDVNISYISLLPKRCLFWAQKKMFRMNDLDSNHNKDPNIKTML